MERSKMALMYTPNPAYKNCFEDWIKSALQSMWVSNFLVLDRSPEKLLQFFFKETINWLCL